MSNFNSARHNTKVNDLMSFTARAKGFDLDNGLPKTTERLIPLYVNKKLIDIKRVKVDVEDT